MTLICLFVSAISAFQGRDSEHRTGLVGGSDTSCLLRDFLASNVLGDDRQRRTTTGPCGVRRRPEVFFPQELRDATGELFSQDAGRHALWEVHEDRDLHSGWILDKQMYVVLHDVELSEGCVTSPRRFPTWVS